MTTTAPVDKATLRKGTEALKRAISAFYDNHGLLAFALARIRHTPRFDIDTIGINDKELVYNPQFIAERTPVENQFIVIHEAAHVFLGHPVRFAGLKLEFEKRYNRKLTDREWGSLHALANTAADLALHGLIKSMPRVPAPSTFLREFGCFAGVGQFKDLPDGKSMEHYFWKLYNDELQKQQEQEKKQQQQNQQQNESDNEEEQDQQGNDGSEGEQDSGQSGGGSGGGEEGDSQGSDQRVGGGEGNGDEQGEQGAGDGGGDDHEAGTGGDVADGEGQAGGGKGGQGGPAKGGEVGDGHGAGSSRDGEASGEGAALPPRTGLDAIHDGELVQHRTQGVGDINPAEADTPEELEQIQREFEQTLAQAVVTAKEQGTLPGWLQSVYEETFGPSGVNWKLLLRRFLDERCREGRSYAKPNRRSAWRKDVIIPAKLGRTSGLGMVIIDTSGSMGNAECAEGLKAISDIVRSLPGEVRVEMLQIDTSIAKRDIYTRSDLPLKAEFAGRGGTDLSSAFNEVRKRRNELKWCICVTDGGWGYYNVADTKVPTFWLFTCKFSQPPKFGQAITVTVR